MTSSMGFMGAGIGLLAVLALSACEGEFGGFRLKSLTATSLRQDKAECTAESRKYGFLSFDNTTLVGETDAHAAGERASARSQADLHRLCMNARGYRKGRDHTFTSTTSTSTEAKE